MIFAESKTMISHAEGREKEAVVSALKLATGKATSAMARRCQNELGIIASQESSKLDEIARFVAENARLTLPVKVPESKAIKALHGIVPRKLFHGTLSGDLLKEKFGRKGLEVIEKMNEKDGDFDNKIVEAFNYMDGRRTAADILVAITSEYGTTDADDMLRTLKDLEKSRLIEFV